MRGHRVIRNAGTLLSQLRKMFLNILHLFQLVTQGNVTKISGTIPATLSDFKIDPPSLLTLPVKNEIPVRVEMTWHPQ